MRIVEKPCVITAEGGLIRLECAGAVVTLDPAGAERAGRHLISRAKEALSQRRRADGLEQFAARVSGRLADQAAEATRQRQRKDSRAAALPAM